MSAGPPTVHAGVLLIGAAGVMIRGASGAGKSTLSRALAERALRSGGFAALVADDRVELSVFAGRLVARCPAGIAGLSELYGRGIVTGGHEPAAVVRLVVDLVPDAEIVRMPEAEALFADVLGLRIARQPVPSRDVFAACRLVEEALARAVDGCCNAIAS